MNVGVGTIMITKFFPYIPVPISTKAITPAVPDAEYKPGKSGQRHGNQMQSPGFWKNPSHHIEYCK